MTDDSDSNYRAIVFEASQLLVECMEDAKKLGLSIECCGSSIDVLNINTGTGYYADGFTDLSNKRLIDEFQTVNEVKSFLAGVEFGRTNIGG